MGLTILIILAVVAAIAFAVFAARRRREIWRTFARRHGLDLSVNGHEMRASGKLGDGHIFELCTLPSRSSDGDELGAREVLMRIRLLRSPPAGLEILRREGRLLHQLDNSLRGESLLVDDDELNRRAVIQCPAGKNPTRNYLGPARAAALLSLFDGCVDENAGLRDGAVFLSSREIVSHVEVLERWRALLESTAAQLDGINRRPSLPDPQDARGDWRAGIDAQR